MRKLIIITINLEDTKMPQEVDTVEEEVASRMAKDNVEVVVAAVADLGLLKSTKTQERLERQSLSTTAQRVKLNEQLLFRLLNYPLDD